MRIFNVFILVTLCFSHVAMAGGTPKQVIQEIAKNAEKAIKLPNGKAVVLFDKGDGGVIVITDNPRWVVKGELYDMFQNKEIKNTHELNVASSKIPFKKLNVDTTNLLSFTANKSKEKTLIVFIDPFDANAYKNIEVINFTTKAYRVRYILTPFSQESVQKLMNFSCYVYKESVARLITRIETKKYGQTQDVCHQDLVSKSYGLSAFLMLKKSPTLIASNDVVSFGMPKSMIAFLAKNME